MIDLLPTCILHIDSLGIHSTVEIGRLLKRYLAAEFLSNNTQNGRRISRFKSDNLDDFFQQGSLPVINCSSYVRTIKYFTTVFYNIITCKML